MKITGFKKGLAHAWKGISGTFEKIQNLFQKNNKKNEQIEQILSSSDEEKLEFLKDDIASGMCEFEKIVEIVKSIESEQNRIKAILEWRFSEKAQLELLETIKNETNLVRYINDENAKGKKIVALKSIKNEKNLQKINNMFKIMPYKQEEIFEKLKDCSSETLLNIAEKLDKTELSYPKITEFLINQLFEEIVNTTDYKIKGKFVKQFNEKLTYGQTTQIFKNINDPQEIIELSKQIKDNFSDESILEKLNSKNTSVDDLAKLDEEDIRKLTDKNLIEPALKYYAKHPSLIVTELYNIKDNEVIELMKEFMDFRYRIDEIYALNEEMRENETKKMEEENKKVQKARNTEDDIEKIALIAECEYDDSKSRIIATIKDPSLKLEQLSNIKNISNIIDIAKEEPDEIFSKSNESTMVKAKILETLKNDIDKVLFATVAFKDANSISQIINEIDDKNKMSAFNISKIKKYEISNENKKLLANSVKEDIDKATIITTIDNDKDKIEILDTITDKNIKGKVLQTCGDKTIFENLEKIGFTQKEISILENMYQTNEEVIREINFQMINEKYVSTLGEDKINLISNFKETQEKILSLSDKEYEVFYKCIDNYTKNNNTDEWTVMADEILDSLCDKEYEDLIENIQNIEEINLDQLTKIIQDENSFDIKTVEDLENFAEIKQAKCSEMIDSNEIDIDDKKTYIMQKVFGHSMKYATKLLKKYGESIESIEDQGLKDYVETIKIISKTEDEDLIKSIYKNLEGQELFIDKVSLERDLKTEYCKLYKQGLYKPEDSQKLNEEQMRQIEITKSKNNEKAKLSEELEGLNVYNAGTEFNILMTSVAAFVDQGKDINDFKEDWNRKAVGSQHFCASYIREDMMGCTNVQNVAYGFSDIKEDALMLSGAEDIYSTGESFVSKADHSEVYYDPDTQINKTEHYNEMDIRRVQGGEKKQPDYIIAFKVENKIENLDKIKQAYSDWEGKLPIVIIDIDECMKQQGKEISKKIEEYEQKEDTSEKAKLVKEITQKVRNNSVTGNRHYKTESKIHEEIKEQLGIEEIEDVENILEQIEQEYKENEENLDEEIEKAEQINNIQEIENEEMLNNEQEQPESNEQEYKIGEEFLKENYEKTTAEERQEVANQIKNIILRTIEEKEK